MAFDDTECFEGLEIPKKGKGIPIMRPKKELLSDIDTVIICCFQHDLQISEKLKKIGWRVFLTIYWRVIHESQAFRR